MHQLRRSAPERSKRKLDRSAHLAKEEILIHLAVFLGQILKADFTRQQIVGQVRDCRMGSGRRRGAEGTH